MIWKYLFGAKSRRLAKKSEGILNVFSKTVKELTEVNALAEKEVGVILSKQQELEAEKLALQGTHTENQKIIDKIKDFLSK